MSFIFNECYNFYAKNVIVFNYTVTKGNDAIQLISLNKIKHIHQNVHIIITV
jgi:hypothetical protein